MTKPSGVRLFAILAREAPVGVVFRPPARRLIRDGWILTREGQREWNRGSAVWITYDPPRIYAKRLRLDNGRELTLKMLIKGIDERDGPWYIIEYQRAVELADFRRLQFEGKAAPDEALRW